MQTEAKDYWRMFKPAACNLALAAGSKEELFEQLLDGLIKAKSLDKALRTPALRALVERETLASTGVGQRVAIPHVKLSGLEEAVFSLSLVPAGIEWNALDGESVTILFTVLRPERASPRYNPERHLDMMRWISTLGRDADFRRFAMGVTTKKALVDLLREMSAP
jgi:PTS system fructose-specific IIC component